MKNSEWFFLLTLIAVIANVLRLLYLDIFLIPKMRKKIDDLDGIEWVTIEISRRLDHKRICPIERFGSLERAIKRGAELSPGFHNWWKDDEATEIVQCFGKKTDSYPFYEFEFTLRIKK